MPVTDLTEASELLPGLYKGLTSRAGVKHIAGKDGSELSI